MEASERTAFIPPNIDDHEAREDSLSATLSGSSSPTPSPPSAEQRMEAATKESNQQQNKEKDALPVELALTPFVPMDSIERRGRGRPRGSGKRQLLATLGDWFALSAGGNFMPHVVIISTGEDVATRILSFAQKGPRSICILSANGSISNVTLRQSSFNGGTLTYEGRFEILSLSGSFTLCENGGSRSRTGGLSVLLAGPDGRVVGGVIAGSLHAASPIQVVVGSFVPNTLKAHKRRAVTNQELPVSATQGRPVLFASPRPISQAAGNGDYETDTSMSRPKMESTNSVPFKMVGWVSGFPSAQAQQRPSHGIDIRLPGEQ